jgi:ubiquinone/menaquinone biosynthesis C-methylase UbiE
VKNTVENNLRAWDERHNWRKDGDEWVGQAKYLRQPYDKWKMSLVEHFIVPNVKPDSAVLEIAPGHGRWSKEIVDRCSALTLVDLSPSCIEHCKEIFASRDHVTYITNDGKSLPGVADGSIDFVWSYDSFVHMDKTTIGAYLDEIDRVLKPGGKAIIHHAGRKHGFLWLRFLRHWGKRGKMLYKWISMEKPQDMNLEVKDTSQEGDGWRSDVSKRIVRDLAVDRKLVVDDQIRFWGESNEFGVPRFGDWITLLTKPASA